jgi:tripartite-type tricarboxylate transporter receptor subunit TctC
MGSLRSVALPLLAAAAILTAPRASDAQTYPTKVVHIIVPFAPGGSADLIARTVAAKLTDGMGQQVVVENRQAGGGRLGVESTVNAAPDGYTLLVTPNGPMSIARYAAQLPYDTMTDLAPVSMLATIPAGIAVNAQLPPKTLAEYIAYAKARPGQLNYAISSIGTHMHLAGELLKSMTGINVVAVPYRGTGPAATALGAGEVQAGVLDLASLLPAQARGAVRILAIADPKRTSTAPDIPTAAEAGVPGFGVTAWIAMFAPAKTPAPIIAKINGEVGKALRMADVRDILTKAGIEPTPSTPEEMGKILRDQIADFGKIIKEANIKFD